MKIEIHQANDAVKASSGNENANKARHFALLFSHDDRASIQKKNNRKQKSHERAFLVFTQNILFFLSLSPFLFSLSLVHSNYGLFLHPIGGWSITFYIWLFILIRKIHIECIELGLNFYCFRWISFSCLLRHRKIRKIHSICMFCVFYYGKNDVFYIFFFWF